MLRYEVVTLPVRRGRVMMEILTRSRMALSDTTRQSLSKHFEVWTRIGLCTARSNRDETERAILDCYRIVNLPAPSRFVWLESPMAGAIAAAQASSVCQSTTKRVWLKPQEFMFQKLWKKAEATKSIEFWKEIETQINSSALALRNNVVVPVGLQIVSQRLEKTQQARLSVFMKSRHSGSNMSSEIWNSAVTVLKQELTLKEQKDLQTAITWEQIAEQLRTCGFGSMDAAFLAFLDYGSLAGFKLTDIDGLVRVANSAGWWWPYDDLCIVTERPTKLFLNKQGKLHHKGGYAIEYADTWGVYALNGEIVKREIAEGFSQVVVE